MIRIISGVFKGHKLKSGKRPTLRPTKDRVKESLFSKLGNIEEKYVIDLFAGSGSLGFEAMSRGAKQAVFVENNSRQIEIIGGNAATLRIEDNVSIIRQNVLSYLKGKISADIIFADPPYQFSKMEELFKLFEKLTKNIEIIFEGKKNFIPPENFIEKRTFTKNYGETSLNFFKT